uniref:Mapmodulin, isoform D n=2 Tax=Drosophila melanogaster TaxID=7227 RepID=E1JGK5_DROME|nr:mapmodulin, isoform C [Drosophila melanogaster]NP_001163184.1 mapmodulin, isoform D [Drosophila melanogaster]AOQ10554.1 Mapmodulin-RC [synthetic construct]ABN49328.1 IP17956p [Drosophila melanogaster]ABV53838.1 mapmodulin, isoform C [Drosophila melanogaster]ACZ94456.1 mapmodulin, isoform D [Drosophila melanogaster]|eukprot:NP_001097361.1 mapmodulin, isoform C [Drosophila melanogaster]
MEKRIELERRARKVNQITELNLDNCRSTSIVGLTDEYTALESLSLINVGLTTLKGFPKLPNLKKLELSDNRISSGLNYLTTSPKLQYLNLSGNKIKDLETLKPLEEFKNLVVLDLFNNDATQVDNYREKIFKMLPSLNFLDGFDCNDEEVQSDGDDDDEVNGNDSDEVGDKCNAFCLNGLEIDLDELEAFEKRVKAKKSLQDKPPPQSEDKEVDELDEYLKELQLRESTDASTDEQSVINATPQPPSNSNLSFVILLYWFLAILNLGSATYFSDEDDDSDDSDEEANGEVSLSEVYNDDLEEDNSDWEGEDEAGEEDEEEDSDIDDADGDANESAASVNAKDKDGEKEADESQVRGKKRKHDG